ncbi:MAG: VCBS repeat-containing protein [Desulfobacteraceae bacterium]|nr:VCBS repeat-containing protein [Desulfobacteraceae bacterium]
MKIMESTLSFFSSRQFEQKRTSEKKLEIWREPVPPPIVQAPAAPAEPQCLEVEALSPELASIRRILEILTGRKIRISNLKEVNPETAPPAMGAAPGMGAAPALEAAPAMGAAPVGETVPESLGWGIRYEESNSYYEAETSRFKSMGAVRTADGKTIDFTLELEMQREFYTEERYRFLAGDALRDPLVINFNGNSADLTDTRFSFDINADGEEDSIAWLARGSGFLVFDRNKDTVVNNGSELFGPQTGNGFSELSEFDEDGNGWIDENDSVFDDLSIWSGPSWDSSFLVSLKEAGVGAISLSTAETEFTLKDETNATKGKIRQTGVYIAENGSVGTVQQVDLVV